MRNSTGLLKPGERPAPRARFTVKNALALAFVALSITGILPSRIYSQVAVVRPVPTGAPPDPYIGPPEGTSDVFRRMEREMLARHAQEENAQMLREVESDSNKLLKLASELDSEIGQSDRDSLTKDEAKKLAEIGKIARKILKKLAKLARRF